MNVYHIMLSMSCCNAQAQKCGNRSLSTTQKAGMVEHGDPLRTAQEHQEAALLDMDQAEEPENQSKTKGPARKSRYDLQSTCSYTLLCNTLTHGSCIFSMCSICRPHIDNHTTLHTRFSVQTYSHNSLASAWIALRGLCSSGISLQGVQKTFSCYKSEAANTFGHQ